MWTYEQSTGRLSLNGVFVAKGYSGADWGKNNPNADHVRMVGPLPDTDWQIVGPPYKHPKLGPYVLKLYAKDEPVPDDTHEATGRGAFRIHGDSIRAPGTASHGCLIFGPAIRRRIWESGDRHLRCIP